MQKPIDLRSDGRLAGRVAVVAGGGATGSDPELPGTGEATAILFASEGASVVVIGRSVDHTNLTVERIRALGGEALGLLGDVTAEADCIGMIKQAVCH